MHWNNLQSVDFFCKIVLQNRINSFICVLQDMAVVNLSYLFLAPIFCLFCFTSILGKLTHQLNRPGGTYGYSWDFYLFTFGRYTIITAKWIWDRSIYSVIKPSIDMTLFQYFWKFTQICKKFAAFACKIVSCKSVQIFRNTGTLPCQMMAQVLK